MSFDYSIEFAHIYLNQNVGEEHRRSAWFLRSFIDEIKRDKKNATHYSVVLVDDYNATERVLDVNILPTMLEESGSRPDFIAYESAMTDGAQHLLGVSQGPEKKSSSSFFQLNHKLPCSLLVATWYLIRLGKIEAPPSLLVGSDASKLEPADQLINILPDYYEKIEARARGLLKESPYKNVISSINNYYFAS